MKKMYSKLDFKLELLIVFADKDSIMYLWQNTMLPQCFMRIKMIESEKLGHAWFEDVQ